MTQSCLCGKPTPENAWLCGDCADLLWRILSDVPLLSVELDLTLSKQRRFESQTSSSRSRETALPYDLAASRVLDELRSELASMVKHCVDEHVPSVDYRDRQADDTLASMSAWLIWRLDGIAAQAWSVDSLRVLTPIYQRAMYVIDRPPERTFAGPCDECGSDLYAVNGSSNVTCKACGLTYDLAARRDWLLQAVDDRLATAVEIARALTSLELPCSAERIRQWKHRDRIEVRGHDKLGRPLFRVGDVADLLIEQHASKSSAS